MKEKKSKMEVHFSRASDEWATPISLFSELHRVFKFTLDAAASSGNAKCARFFTKEDDALKQKWGGEIVFLNPPYSMLREFMAKAYTESKENGATVVCLIPSRTDTRAWHDFIAKGEVRFIRGRVSFVKPGDAKPQPAPFPSVLVVFRPRLGDLKI